MRWNPTLFTCAALAFCFTALSQAAPSTALPSTTPGAYLNQVLDLMQAHALHRDEIDWPAVRREAMARAASAITTMDTYPAIFFAMTQLKEGHSFFMLPRALSEAERKRASASMKAILAPYRHQGPKLPASVFRNRSVPEGKLLHLGDTAFAYVVVPTCWLTQSYVPSAGGSYYQSYADSLHAAAVALVASHPQGWIVDLRGNRGGDMYPMIAGIGFVLGQGTLGYFVSPASIKKDEWFYRQGGAGEMVGAQETIDAKVTEPPLSLPNLPPVAVLLDSGTASSGEVVAISFMGRPHTRFFGAYTLGLTTANKAYPLPDGAALFLSVSVEEDRNQREYLDGVEPEVVLSQPSVLPAEGSDPVIRAAEQWLLSQHAN